MNRYFLLLLLLFAACCKDKVTNVPPNSRVVKVPFMVSLGDVSFSLPSRYDTGVSWNYHSDYTTCGFQYFRFQPKELRIVKDGGLGWLGEPEDSIEHFTIKHPSYICLGDTTCCKADTNVYYRYRDALLRQGNTFDSVTDSIQKIGNRYFSIIVLQKDDSLHLKRVIGITQFNNNLFQFEYKLLTRKEDSVTVNFVKDATALLRTIRMRTGMGWLDDGESVWVHDRVDKSWLWNGMYFK